MQAIISSEKNRLNARFFWLVFGYFLLNMLLRLAVSPTIDIDHAEQMYLSQFLQLGYNGQPPLFTYLSHVIFSVFGVNFVWLLVVKLLLLFGIAYAMWRISLHLAFSPVQQLVCVLGLALIPHIIYHSQRMLTHTVLVTFFAVATLWQVVALFGSLNDTAKKTSAAQNTWRYVLIGVLAAGGMLSKYNYFIFLASVVVTMLLLPKYRQLIITPKFLLAVAVCSALFMPHFLWSLENFATASAGLHRIEAKENQFFQGLGSGVLHIVSFGALLLVCSLPIFLARKKQRAHAAKSKPAAHPHEQFFLVLSLMIFLAMVLFIFATDASVVKERWFQPMYFYLPILVAMSVPQAVQHTEKAIKVFYRAAVFFAVLAMLILPAGTLLGNINGKFDWSNRPYITIFKEVQQPYTRAGTQPAFMIAESTMLAGNARQVFTSVPIFTASDELQQSFKHAIKQGEGVLICETAQCDNQHLQSWLKDQKMSIHHDIQTVQQPFYYGKAAEVMPLYMAKLIKP